MEVMGTCAICGRAAKLYTCMMCGRLVCSRCMDHSKGICVQCAHQGMRFPVNDKVFK